MTEVIAGLALVGIGFCLGNIFQIMTDGEEKHESL